MPDHSLVINNATIIDGSGRPRYTADVAVHGDRIVAIGTLDPGSAERRLDARGLVLAPGFIDAHTHDDRLVLSGPDMLPKLSQGVTSVVAGNCGVSLAPLVGIDPPPPLNLLGDREWYRFASVSDYMDEVTRTRPGVNIAMLCGHSTLRTGAMDRLDRAATGEEIARMGERLDRALDEGCIGLSTGLAYPPAFNAPTEEVIALAAHAAAHGGLYVTHMRDEKEGLLDSVRETLRIGREAALPVVISHHKCSGRPNWGMSRDSLKLIAEARKQQSVNLDVYPYTASSTVLIADWVPSAEKVLVTWSKPHPEHNGRDLAELCAEWGVDSDEACARLSPAGAIYFQMDDADLERIMAFEDAMIGSDGLPHDEVPHPRLWGTFPRVLGHYSRDKKLFGLEEAVRRMSGIAASVFGFADRGILREGAYADLVLFDPERVIDGATFANPKQIAPGIERVWVNGVESYVAGKVTGQRAGRVLRRQTRAA
jgi:N-acyl-D-amino-acid deacylase